MTGVELQILIISLQILFGLLAFMCAAGNSVSRELFYPIFLYISGIFGGAGIALGLIC